MAGHLVTFGMAVNLVSDLHPFYLHVKLFAFRGLDCDGDSAVLWQMAVTTKLPLGEVKYVYTKADALKGRVVGVMEQPWVACDEDGAQDAPSKVARVLLSAWVPTGNR
jgi:hypothetical protein